MMLYALIWIERKPHRVCPDLFATRPDAKRHLEALHKDLPATEVEVVRSDLLRRFFPDDRLDAPDAMAIHVDSEGAAR